MTSLFPTQVLNQLQQRTKAAIKSSIDYDSKVNSGEWSLVSYLQEGGLPHTEPRRWRAGDSPADQRYNEKPILLTSDGSPLNIPATSDDKDTGQPGHPHVAGGGTNLPTLEDRSASSGNAGDAVTQQLETQSLGDSCRRAPGGVHESVPSGHGH